MSMLIMIGDALGISDPVLAAGSPATFESATVSETSVCSLSSSSAIVAYRDGGNSFYITVCHLSISGTTVTPATPVVVENAAATDTGICALSATSAVVTYKSVTNSGYGTACHLGVSGSTITPGTPTVFESASVEFTSVATIDSSNCIVVYQDEGNSSYGTACHLGISGSTITPGTPVVFESATTYYTAVAVLDSSNAIVAYRDGGNSSYGTACHLGISGSTITPGTPAVFESATTNFVNVCSLGASSALVFYRDGGNSNLGTVCQLGLSGSTITPGTPASLGSGTMSTPWLAALGSSSVIAVYQDASTSYAYACHIDVSGATVSPGTPIEIKSAAAPWTTVSTLSSTSAVACYSSVGTTGESLVITYA